LKAGTADQFLADMGLDFVFGNSYMLLESDPYRMIFEDRLIALKYIAGPDNFMLYDYIISP
jgi:hypothetical protein